MKSADFLAHALSIESDLIGWGQKWANILAFANLSNLPGEPPDVFSDHWHIYPDTFVGSLWNHYRSIRIELHQIIINHLDRHEDGSLTLESMAQLPISENVVVAMSHEICASIPYFLSQDTLSEKPPLLLKNTTHARLIIWPLFVAGWNTFASGKLRVWVAEQLEKIGNSMGIWKSNALGNLVRTNTAYPVQSWRNLGMWDEWLVMSEETKQ